MYMKKVMMMAAACIFGAAAFAAETVYVKVSLIPGSTAAGSTANVYNMTLSEDDAYTNGFDADADADAIDYFANDKSVMLFGVVGTHKCQDVVAANLEKLYIGFATNKTDTKYSLSFSEMEATRVVKLYDAVEDSVIIISNTTPAYEFTVDADQVSTATKRVYITDRFMIGEPEAVDYQICHQNGNLEVSGYKNGRVVVSAYDVEGATPVIDVVVPTRNKYSIDLSNLEDGQYVVEANGTKLVIKK